MSDWEIRTTGDETKCLLCRRNPPRAGYVCDRCRIGEVRRLGEIGTLYALLPAALEANPVVVIDLTYPATGGAHATVTIHEAPEYDDQHGVINAAATLDSWAREWASTLRATDLPKVPTVPRLARWLQTWLPIACDSHPAIDDYAAEIRHLAAGMRRAINRDLTPMRYEAPCPYCGTKTLRREAGGDWIECGGRDGCGRLWGEDEYGLLARACIDEDILLTTEEAAVVARVEVSTVRSWVYRKRLTIIEQTEDGRNWFRKGDVEGLAA